jgi:hypothetical protein
MPPTPDKDDCLAHYAEGEPRLFHQFDGFHPPSWPVGPGTEDADNDELWAGATWELMGGADVRVLISPDADNDVVLRLLRKIAAWIERRGGHDMTGYEWSRVGPRLESSTEPPSNKEALSRVTSSAPPSTERSSHAA